MALEEIEEIDAKLRETYKKEPETWNDLLDQVRETDSLATYAMVISSILVLSERTGIPPFRIATWFALILPRKTANEERAEDAWLN